MFFPLKRFNNFISVPVRLSDIESSEGYVEGLGINGQWGAISQNGFDKFAAKVICKMLGFASVKTVLKYPDTTDLFGDPPLGNLDNFVLANLGCTGEETSVFDCQHTGEWNEEYFSNQIAGVQCGPGKL